MKEPVEIVPCPVCGPAPASTFWKSAGETAYVRCASCGLVYASPRAAHSSRYAWLDKSFTVTPELLEQLEGRNIALEMEARFIQKNIAGGRLLDIGCSTGDFFARFPSLIWERHGVELIESAAQYSREKYNAKVHCGDLNTASYPDCFFDLVTMIDTFYYVDDPALELKEIFRITRPNGLLAIELAGQSYALWRNYGWAPRLLDGRVTRADSDSSYLFWFNADALRRILRNHGFNVVGTIVVPSPGNDRRALNWLINFHFGIMRFLCALSPRFLDWSPKWMVLARKIEVKE